MEKFNKEIQKHFEKMCKSGKLFRVNMSGQQIWDLYLKSFPEGEDPVFRDPQSSTHNCNHCNNFIRRYGNIVAIDKNKIVSLFDIKAEDEFTEVAKALSKAIKSSKVSEVFFETFNELNNLPYEKCSMSNPVFRLGIDKNVKRYTQAEAELYGVVKPNETKVFNHMHIDLPVSYVNNSGKSIEAIMGEYRDAKNVFQRAMEEISIDTLLLVKDLIIQDSLLDGQTHLFKIEQMIPLKKEYDELPKGERDNWCWVTSFNFPLAKFRNELMGTLCSELSSGEELNKACESWNKRVDPVNYMKASAPITKRQIEEAREFVESNGYAESFNRRMATIDDIKASEIQHINVGDGKVAKDVSIFDGVKASKPSQHKRNEFDGVEEVSIDKFMKDILPSCTSVEAFLLNSHEGNLVSMTTANIPESKPIFKWPNNYSWTFNGNLAGKSQIKSAVASKGGNVNGILRFSIMWAEGDVSDNSDLDAWAQEPTGTSIGYDQGYRKDNGNRKTPSSGQLDVDITNPAGYNHKNIVENIVWDDASKMKNGVYRFWVNQFSDRGSKGFRAEIEFNGEIYSYEYDRRVSGNVQVAKVTLKDGNFTIEHALPETAVSSKEYYGLATNEFHKVNLVCLSPNHWEGSSVGNKHFFFMLDGCRSPHSIRAFHNENLISELLAHRKVMEVLGATAPVESTDKQLSGLGFNATVRDELIVKLSGNFKRVVKIKF